MYFVIAIVVIYAYLADVIYAKRVEKSSPALGHEMSVRDVESPLEVIGLNGIKKPLCLFDIVWQIVNLGVFGFQIVVFKIDQLHRFFPLDVPVVSCVLWQHRGARPCIAKVIAPMADDPAASQPNREVKIGVYIVIDGFG